MALSVAKCMALSEVILEPRDEGERIDRVLARRLDESRTQIQRWIDEGCIRVEGKAILPRSHWPAGTCFQIDPPEPPLNSISPEKMELDILFEDNDLLVINKPAGRVVHPGAGIHEGTLVAGLLHYCGDRLSRAGDADRPGIVHRLDKETSGIMVVTKTDEAYHHLVAAFKAREVQKEYLAYVHRGPSSREGTWDFPIGRHPVNRQKQAVRADTGRHAVTDFRVEATWEKFSRLVLRLHTGRTHQIRVHAAHVGCPLVGDCVYGGKPVPVADVRRQLLHACRLGFSHPFSGEDLAFEAPLPDDFHRFETWLNTTQKNSNPR